MILKLHSSLPRHIERNLSLNKASREPPDQLCTKDLITGGTHLQEDSTFCRSPEDVKLSGMIVIGGQPIYISTSVAEKPQSALGFCPTCNTRLTDSQFSSTSDFPKGKRRKRKNFCSMLLSCCCKGRCNIAKARVRHIQCLKGKLAVPNIFF